MAVTPFKSSDNFNMAGFNEKITEADNTYVAKTGDSMTGALSMGNNKITDVASPVNDGDAATKGYVDSADPLFAKHKKIAILTNEWQDVFSLSEQNYFDAKKLFSIIYKFNNYTVKINATSNNITVCYSVRKDNRINLIEDIICAQDKIVSGEQFTLNNIIKKECIYIGNFNRPMIPTVGGYARQTKYSSPDDDIVRSVYLQYSNAGAFNYISGNIEVWVRTIDD